MDDQPLLPWNDSGLKLLKTIEAIISKHGGIEAYRELIAGEVEMTTHQNHTSKLYRSFEKVMKYKMSIEDAAELLGMNTSQFHKQYYAYKAILNQQNQKQNG